MPVDDSPPEFFHQIYGFTLCANRPLPGLDLHAPGPSHKDIVRVYLSEAREDSLSHCSGDAIYISDYIGEFEIPVLKIFAERDGFRLIYDDGTVFFVSRDGSEIRGTWPPAMTFEDAVTYLTGPVMGFLMHLRQKLCFHASVIAIGKHAVILLGAAGAGKSTMAAAFSQRGFQVLSDDVAALEETGQEAGRAYRVHSGWQRVCLTPEITGSLYGAPDALPPVTPNWDKRGLELGNSHARFANMALPLGAIYLLGERDSSRSAVEIESLTARESLMELLAHTYVQYFMTPDQRAHELPAVGRLAAGMPVRKIFRPQGTERLKEACSTIVENCAWSMAS